MPKRRPTTTSTGIVWPMGPYCHTCHLPSWIESYRNFDRSLFHDHTTPSTEATWFIWQCCRGRNLLAGSLAHSSQLTWRGALVRYSNDPIISPHAKDPVSGEMRTVITVHVCGPARHRCESSGEATCDLSTPSPSSRPGPHESREVVSIEPRASDSPYVL
jgi:hypothetical protein